MGLEEIGKVLRIEKDIAVVEVAKSAACATCRACCIGQDGKTMVAEARNIAGAKAGDRVNLGLEARSILKAAFVVYMIPFFFLILGYAVGSWLATLLLRSYSEEAGLVTGFFLLGLSYFVVWTIDKKAEITREYQPVVAKIVSRKEGKKEERKEEKD